VLCRRFARYSARTAQLDRLNRQSCDPLAGTLIIFQSSGRDRPTPDGRYTQVIATPLPVTG